MVKRIQVLVVGYGDHLCTRKVERMAYQVDKALAEKGCVLLTGGLGGVMRAASKGARGAGGITVSIVPGGSVSEANEFSDIVVATTIGIARDFVTAASADAVIVIGGGVGTLIEVGVAYMKEKPIVAVRGSGGVADQYAGKYLDERRTVKIRSALTCEAAVDLALKLCNSKQLMPRKKELG